MSFRYEKAYGRATEDCRQTLDEIFFAKITRQNIQPIGLIILLPFVLLILLAFEAYLVIETVRTGFQVGLLMGFIFGTLLLLSSVLLLLFDIRRIKRKSKPISYFLLRDKSNLFKVQARHMTDTEYEVDTITLIKSGKSIRIHDKEHCKVGAEKGTLAEVTGFYQFLTSDFGLAEYIKKSPTFFTIGIKQRENRTIYYFKRNLGSNLPVLVKRRKILLEDGLPKTIWGQMLVKKYRMSDAKSITCHNAKFTYSLVNDPCIKLRIPQAIRECVKQSEFPLPAEGTNLLYF